MIFRNISKQLKKSGASRLDVIVLAVSMIFIFAACTTVNTGGSTAENSPAVTGSPSPSAAVSAEVTPSTEQPSAMPATYPAYRLQPEFGSIELHLGVQDGLYPWGLTFGETQQTSHRSGDMPGTVFYKVKGDGFRLFYRHIEETGKDVISSYIVSSDTCVTARGVKVGDPVEKLLEKYSEDLLYQPEPYPPYDAYDINFYICDELYIYTRAEDDNCCILFYVWEGIEGKTIGRVQISLGQDGGPAYFADNVNTFPVDYSTPGKYTKTDTSAEEKVHSLYTAQAPATDILEAMASFNWRLYDQLYRIEALDVLGWLYQQDIPSEHDILCVLRSTQGLDGGYSEGYSDILAKIYNAGSRTFIRLASRLDDTKIDLLAQLLCFGVSDKKDQVITELRGYQNNGSLSEKEQLVVADILHYFQAWY